MKNGLMTAMAVAALVIGGWSAGAGVGVSGGTTVTVNLSDVTTNAILSIISATNDALHAEMLATNALRVAAELGKQGTNSTLDKIASADGSVLTNMATAAALTAAAAGKQGTNSTLDKIASADGSVLTNMATAAALTAAAAGKQGTNAALSVLSAANGSMLTNLAPVVIASGGTNYTVGIDTVVDLLGQTNIYLKLTP